MSLRIRQILTVLYGLLTILVSAVCLCPAASAAGCPPLPTDKGTATATFTVAAAGTYRLWAHVYAPSTGNGAFYATIDSQCPADVGSTLPADTFGWTGSASGAVDVPITVKLTSGTHTLTIAGQEAGAGVDQVLLLASSTCVPTGDGSNCMAGTASGGESGDSETVMKTVKLAAYAIAAIIGITLIVFISSRLIGHLPFLKHLAPTRAQPQFPIQPGLQPSSLAQPYNAFAPADSVITPPVAPAPPPRHKHKLVLIVGASIIVIGLLITAVVMGASDNNIAISLVADAKVSGQAQIVANAAAINGYMVEFGSAAGGVPVSGGATPSGGTSQQSGNTQSGSASGSGTGSKSSGSKSGAGAGTGTNTGSGSGTVAGGGSTGGTSSGTLLGNVSCNYQVDTWSGDASKVGYSASKVSSSDGNPASFSVKLNANKGTTEVVGYPSDQCLMYSALPTNLNSSFNITPPASSNGLDYEYAYDIWLTTATAAKAANWDTDLELMIWTYTNGQVPLGSVKATLSDGAKAWVAGNNTTGTVSVVYSNTTSGNVNIASIVSQLESLGYVSSSYNGILDVEYGIEAPYGGNQTFAVNSLSLYN